MKIRILLKDPDTMPDAVEEAANKLPCPDGVSADEWAVIREKRAEAAQQVITDLWMEYGEYLCVEFDTEAKTATVLPSGSESGSQG